MSLKKKAVTHSILIVCLLCLWPARALAWGDTGHRVVARIAVRYLGDKTANEIEKILSIDSCSIEKLLEGKVACTASWADPPLKDQRPYTANWHFVDIPVTLVDGKAGKRYEYDMARDCYMTERGDCAILAFERLKYVLANRHESQISRAEALKFIIHIMGDLHQPFHCITDKKDANDKKDLGDLGGNFKIVQWMGADFNPRWNSQWNLHSVWDEGIIDHTMTKLNLNEDAYVERLLSGLPKKEDQKLKAIQGGDILTWAAEGYNLAIDKAYAKLPPFDKNYKYLARDGQPRFGGYRLTENYYTANSDVVDDQLRRAGARLGRLLNEILR